jgi:hypothetical protein
MGEYGVLGVYSKKIPQFRIIASHEQHGEPKCRKGAGSKFKKFRQLTHLAEHFKTGTISWGFAGFTNGRMAKVLGINL